MGRTAEANPEAPDTRLSPLRAKAEYAKPTQAASHQAECLNSKPSNCPNESSSKGKVPHRPEEGSIPLGTSIPALGKFLGQICIFLGQRGWAAALKH